jgi:hypothetical protein
MFVAEDVSMRTQLKRLSMVMVVLLLGACASSQSEPKSLDQLLSESGYTQGPAVERIQSFRVNGWNYLDRKHVIITVDASRRYLLNLRISCNGLFGAEIIAFTNTVSYLTKFDQLLVRDSTSVLERCPIESMNELNRVENNPTQNS